MPITFGNLKSNLRIDESSLALLSYLKEFFAASDINAFLVGGFLRDVLLGKLAPDIDIAIHGDAIFYGQKLAEITKGKLIILDGSRRVVRVVLDKQNGFISNHIDLSEISGSIEEDLAYRDFTVDSMAVPMSCISNEIPMNNLIDLFGGLRDLRSGAIRIVSENCFKNDPARLLRSIRLVAQLGFSIEYGTKEAILEDSYLVDRISGERVREEFLKILEQPKASENLELMDSVGLLCKIIPELEYARGVVQPKEHYWDVFNHCIKTPSNIEKVTMPLAGFVNDIASYVPWDESLEDHFSEIVSDGFDRKTMLKLSGLLHDISKPATKNTDNDGRIRFIGHDVRGSEVCRTILTRLRISNRGINLVSDMVKYHLRPTQMRQGESVPTERALFRYYRDLGEVAFDTLYLNLADYLSVKGDKLYTADWREHCMLIRGILDNGLSQSANKKDSNPPKLVDGNILMNVLGIPPSQHLGLILRRIQEATVLGEITTREEAIELARNLL